MFPLSSTLNLLKKFTVLNIQLSHYPTKIFSELSGLSYFLFPGTCLKSMQNEVNCSHNLYENALQSYLFQQFLCKNKQRCFYTEVIMKSSYPGDQRVNLTL